MKPLFSIIIPTFNRKNEISRCLESVKRGTFKSYEIIVVDDGSTDGTRDYIVNHHPDVRYFYQDNEGVAKARNIGMEQACGKNYAFLDSDDVWYSERLHFLASIITLLPPEVGLIFNDMDKLIKGEGEGRSFSDTYFGVKRENVTNIMTNKVMCHFDKNELTVPHGDIFPELLKGNVIQPSCAIMKQEVYDKIGGFREDFRVANDSEYFLRVSKSYQIAYVPLILTSLEPPRSSISLSLPKNSIEKIENTIKVIKGYWDTESCENIRQRLQERLAGLHARLAYHYLSIYNLDKARFHYRHTLCINSKQIKSYLMYFFSFAPLPLLRFMAEIKRKIQRFKG